jgi:hypothetical protein
MPPGLLVSDVSLFKVWTDLYICLSLRRIAMEMTRKHPRRHAPLFVFFEPKFTKEDREFLHAHHVLAVSKPFELEDATLASSKVTAAMILGKVHMEHPKDVEVCAVIATMTALMRLAFVELAGARQPYTSDDTCPCSHLRSPAPHSRPDRALQAARPR